MDEELCNIIDKIAEKIGVAIDWSSENVMPYIQDIMQRYRTMNIVNNIIVMTVCAIIITICAIVAVKIIKGIINSLQNTESSIWFDADYDMVSAFSIATCTIIASSFLISGIVLCDAIGELMGWLYVPEVKLLEVLKGFM